MSELILPNGQPLIKAEGRAKADGLTPWGRRYIEGQAVRGAVLKKGRWRDLYDMYRTHAIVRAAIDKTAKTATNTGYDFVPRDSRAKVNEAEAKILKDFFSKQPDFMYELRRIYKDLMIYGDAYLYVVPDRRRKPIKLKRIAPRTIHIKVAKNGEVINYIQKDLDDIEDEPIIFQPHEILHFRIDDPDNDVYGLSPLASLVLAVSADLYAQRYNASFFLNSGVSGTIISIKNAEPEEINRNRKWLMENYSGPEAAHKPLVLEGENVTVEKAVVSHNEMGFLEGRRFIILEILSVLDVPPVKIGITENANRSTSKEQDKTFRSEAISPLQTIVQNVINDYFIREILGVEEMIFVHSEADTRDAIEQMDYFTKGQAWGIFNANEIRGKLGMAPVDGGEVNGIMTPTGFVPLDRLSLYWQMPRTNTDTVPPTAKDPAKGEPPPPKTPKTSVTGSSPVTKSMNNDEYVLQGALMKLNEAITNDVALRQLGSYLHEACQQTTDQRVQQAFDLVQKAGATDVPFLRQGYIERASEALVSLFMDAETFMTNDAEYE